MSDLKNIFQNIQARGLKDVLNPQLWKAYTEWKEIEANGLDLAQEDIMTYAEQLMYRRLMCPQCVSDGACVHCKCPTDHKMVVPGATCTNFRWQKMQSTKDWQDFKDRYRIQFIVEGFTGWIDNSDAIKEHAARFKELSGIHLEASEIIPFCEQMIVFGAPVVSYTEWPEFKINQGLKISVLYT